MVVISLILIFFVFKRILISGMQKSIISRRFIKTNLKLSKSSLSLIDLGLLCENSFVKQLRTENTVIRDEIIAAVSEDTDSSNFQDSAKNSGQFIPRQIKKAHFVFVNPEPVPSPYHVAVSSSLALSVFNIKPEEISSETFVNLFSGNKLIRGFDKPWASSYGCHCYGSWFGQLGDGRAMSIGEVVLPECEQTPLTEINVTADAAKYIPVRRYELQLKGCGRTPFSRGFDGRAVLRSCIREYLVSESMHHLGVPTSRALCVVGTGQRVRRPWYQADSAIMSEVAAALSPNNYVAQDDMHLEGTYPKSDSELPSIDPARAVSYVRRGGKFSPDVMLHEKGAIMCRTAPSFLRFAQLELFFIREEWVEMAELADYVCMREYPHLTTESAPEKYVQMFREVARRAAYLVVQWLRVGYVQGNMNSDNTLLGGRTVDYGPYGVMERFNPFYQPFTSDSDGKFCYIRQPTAMETNVHVLGKCLVGLLRHVCDRDGLVASPYIESLRLITTEEFGAYFYKYYADMRRSKLGFKPVNPLPALINCDGLLNSGGSGGSSTKFDASAVQENDTNLHQIYSDLEKLLYTSSCDFTIFFRLLADATDAYMGSTGLIEEKRIEIAYKILLESFYKHDPINSLPTSDNEEKVKSFTNVTGEPNKMEWANWLKRYFERLSSEQWDASMRRSEMNRSNPKYVLRNWMAILAYEHAQKDDYSVLQELELLLTKPYDSQSEESEKRWFR